MNEYQENLKKKMDEYAHFIYRVCKEFPKEETFGIVSQIKRAVLSIILNYIEGYARKRPLVRLNFLETAYGSLKESKYLLYFSSVENYLSKENYNIGLKMAEEIGAMLWREIDNLEKSLKT